MFKKKILVVGGTGFIGLNLIKKLNKTKFSITSLSLNKVKKKNRLNSIKYIFCDISKKTEIEKNINNEYDYIINLGGNIDHSNKKETYSSHYLGFKNLVDIFKKKKLKSLFKLALVLNMVLKNRLKKRKKK